MLYCGLTLLGNATHVLANVLMCNSRESAPSPSRGQGQSKPACHALLSMSDEGAIWAGGW